MGDFDLTRMDGRSTDAVQEVQPVEQVHDRGAIDIRCYAHLEPKGLALTRMGKADSIEAKASSLMWHRSWRDNMVWWVVFAYMAYKITRF